LLVLEGDVSTVWPSNATEEQIKNRSVPRVEIFKMPGGTEYIIHDVNENNIIIGKARISGHVRVSESMSVDGFGGRSILDGANESNEKDLVLDSESSRYINDFFNNPRPPTFHPPSFGVTVLGNSHGFDKSGSVSGYVLWINGRGVMIDPPPYSSATLEREGIRPRTIVGIILTHCHADHDAGAFQKVLTGSPVVVITTPTIYKSFIRKYAALSALSPALLRHSHRFKPAIIGEPLRFQGATFQFTYTLHTIPCVGFRVEWRGRSMVFTGDHFNSPPDMEKLEQSGVLSKSRAADLRNLPLQDCDLLLHEAGAPPIHTPLEVLLKLPEKVKKRLFVVHTSALPPDCELKAAPTGTQGTIRLDKSGMGQDESNRSLTDVGFHQPSVSIFETQYENTWNFRNEYEDSPKAGTGIKSKFNLQSSISSNEPFVSGPLKGRTSVFNHGSNFEAPPLVALRPSSSTDAWYILNLLSAVPFLSRYVYNFYFL
jgi:phosphoribosyl 1,2-cyclic phosphodiesterase